MKLIDTTNYLREYHEGDTVRNFRGSLVRIAAILPERKRVVLVDNENNAREYFPSVIAAEFVNV